MDALTFRQSDVLSFVVKFKAEKGMPPTRAEIAAGMGWASANAADLHIRALAKKKALSITPGISRGIVVL